MFHHITWRYGIIMAMDSVPQFAHIRYAQWNYDYDFPMWKPDGQRERMTQWPHHGILFRCFWILIVSWQPYQATPGTMMVFKVSDGWSHRIMSHTRLLASCTPMGKITWCAFIYIYIYNRARHSPMWHYIIIYIIIYIYHMYIHTHMLWQHMIWQSYQDPDIIPGNQCFRNCTLHSIMLHIQWNSYPFKIDILKQWAAMHFGDENIWLLAMTDGCW